MEGSVHVRVTVKVLINLQCFCDPPPPLKSMEHLGCVNLRRCFVRIHHIVLFILH